MLPFALLLLGLGLLLTGVSMLSEALKRIGSRTFRILSTKYMSPRWKALLFGLGAGTAMQGTSAALIILSSIHFTGGLTLQQAMAILTGFSVGNCILPFLVSFKIKVGVFLVVGLSATLLHFIKDERRRNICSLAFGLGLIFFGIEMMLEGVAPLRGEPWFSRLMELSTAWPAATIAAGTGLGLLMQSSTTVTLVAIGLIKGGVMTPQQALPVMYGAIIGSALFRSLVGSAFKGSGRQLFAFMNFYNYLGAGLFILMYFMETKLGTPLVLALLPKLSPLPEMQVAWVFLLISLTSAAVLTVFLNPLAAWLERKLPPTEEEDLSKPIFLWAAHPEDPETALALIQKEQLREMDQIAAFFPAARKDYQGLDLKRRHDAFGLLAAEVEAAMTAATTLRLGHDAASRQITLQARQTLIKQLADSAFEFLTAIQAARSASEIAGLSDTCFEALDFLFMDAAEQLKTGERDLEHTAMYGDRGTQMEQLRASYFKDGQSLSAEARTGLVALTTGVEKCVWLLNRLLGMSVVK